MAHITVVCMHKYYVCTFSCTGHTLSLLVQLYGPCPVSSQSDTLGRGGGGGLSTVTSLVATYSVAPSMQQMLVSTGPNEKAVA